MDLFTTHLNHHLPVWFSQTAYPMVTTQNALIQPWTGMFLYTFPPIPLIERTLINIREDQMEVVVLIALSWPRRSWYHLLLQDGICMCTVIW